MNDGEVLSLLLVKHLRFNRNTEYDEAEDEEERCCQGVTGVNR